MRRAFVRSLEVIGEAVKNISEEFKTKLKHIPWRDIAGMRDKLIHEYFGVNYEVVWKTVKEDIPGLRADIENIAKKKS